MEIRELISDDSLGRTATGFLPARSATGSNRRKLVMAGADALIALAVVAGMVLVPFVSSQNQRLRQQLAVTTSNVRSLETTLRHNIELSALDGTVLPERLAQKMAGQRRGSLVVAYTYTVCSRCLYDGLESLRTNRSLREHAISLNALVGERSPRDRERALLLREDGLLSFPITFVPNDELFGALFRHMGNEFADEPIYLRLDEHRRIQAAFQADQRRPALLDAWLDAIQ